MEQTAFHPGEHIQEELDALCMTADALASQIGFSRERLLLVISGETNVTAELALRLGHFFGTSAEFWLNLQSLFDLEMAARHYGAEIEALPTLQAA
jgi:addiction module HigA family antidote